MPFYYASTVLAEVYAEFIGYLICIFFTLIIIMIMQQIIIRCFVNLIFSERIKALKYTNTAYLQDYLQNKRNAFLSRSFFIAF